MPFDSGVDLVEHRAQTRVGLDLRVEHAWRVANYVRQKGISGNNFDESMRPRPVR